MLGLLFAVTTVVTPTALDSLHFSRADVETLKEIQRVRNIGRGNAELLLTAPVIGMLTSGNLAEFVVSVVTADFAGHAEAASNLSKIAACEVVQIIGFRLIDSRSPPSSEVARYFGRLQDTADRACSGQALSHLALVADVRVGATQSATRPRRARSTQISRDTVVRYALVGSIKRFPTEPFLYFDGATTAGGVCTGAFSLYEVPVGDLVRMDRAAQCAAKPTMSYQRVVFLRGQGRVYKQDSIPKKMRIP